MNPLATAPFYVPPEYYGWVDTAATGTGLPPIVVASQINEESGFDPNVTSPTGAEGIAQFEPGTYAAVGGSGSEYNPQNELHPYITLTNQNLQWSGGNVAKALAAYNAGQGNWQAGMPYANTILTNAGKSPHTTVTPTDKTTGGGGGGGNSPTANLLSFNPLNPATWVSTDIWERVGLAIFGALLILVGIFMLAGKQTIKIAKDAAVL